jgi:lysophospholipid acyltransferase (LPLAT)-like uncharacterized protein
MKVNPAFVFILIITTLLAIHTPVHSYLAITLALRHSVTGLLSWPSHLPRCFRLSSWDGLILDSYHGPYTFFLRCLRLSSWDGLILGSYYGPHTFYKRCLRLSSWDGLILLHQGWL